MSRDFKEQPITDFAVIKENSNLTCEKVTDSNEKYLGVKQRQRILRTACKGQHVFAASAKNFMQ